MNLNLLHPTRRDSAAPSLADPTGFGTGNPSDGRRLCAQNTRRVDAALRTYNPERLRRGFGLKKNTNTPPPPHKPTHPLSAYAVSGTQRGGVAKPFGSKQAVAQESRKVESRI